MSLEQAKRPYPNLRRTRLINWTQLLAQIGHWMQKNGTLIRRIQWSVVVIYGALVIIPAWLPLPGEAAHLWNHLTIFSQFIFWGIWWPFVLLSIVLLGRLWCGVLCPEGTLSEFASKHGLSRAIPRWMRWGGWPLVTFVLTTIYGQMVSVYQYPKATLLVLGGSTLAAIAIGLIYGREKRVWCKYLCPVNGVFALLARLAPFHYKVDENAWRHAYAKAHRERESSGIPVIPVNCAPLVPLRHMKGNTDCHMCARCSGHRNAIALTGRSPSTEVVELGAKQANGWNTGLILYGLLGIAIGAFHWSISPWFIVIKQTLAGWLVDRDIFWPLNTQLPWFLFTHYPEKNDVFSWLDGGLLITYILATSLIYGTLLTALLSAAARCLGRWRIERLHHFAQALIPIASCGVFIGLTANTLAILRAEHMDVSWANHVRFALLAGANLWSVWLAWRITGHYTTAASARAVATTFVVAALAVVNSAWWLMFWYW